MDGEQIKRQIGSALERFIHSDSGNAMTAHQNMKIYEAPLVGYAAAYDVYFDTFRNEGVVGPDFVTPENWLCGANTVISYFLPFAREIRESNAAAGLPSEEWVSARIDGEVFNNAVRAFLVRLIENLGEKAVAPVLDQRFYIRNNISNWSERHVAFAAGLGTFGLQRGLITDKGNAGRFGSVVTTLRLTPTPRPYTDHTDYCLFYSDGSCGLCVKRCPPAAMTKQGKDNKVCSDFIDNVIGCGKCNTGVPCEYSIPIVC